MEICVAYTDLISACFHYCIFLSMQTAKDILGVDLALSVIQRVMKNPSGTLLLEVCRALWALQALKEKKSIQAIERLDHSLKLEGQALETSLASRPVHAAGVEQWNENQRQQFVANCQQQRQNLLTGIAWEFRQLLAIQQQVLCKFKVPTFEDGPTVDAGALDLQARVCSYLHSAFFLRSRVGEAPHVNMLKGHLRALEKEQSSGPPPAVRRQQQQPPPPPQYTPQPQPPMPPQYGGYAPPMNYPPQQQQQQQQLPLPPPPPPRPYGNQQQYPPQPPHPYYR